MDLSERGATTAGRHPWEIARSRFFRSLIARHVDLSALRSVLDVGAGDGWFAGKLVHDVAAQCELVCWDVNYTADDVDGVDPSLAWRVRRVTDAPHNTFDLVLALDVIEHIADDRAFLGDAVVPHLHDSSLLVVSVPAYQRLYSDHDRALGHERRYRPHDLHRLLREHVDVVEHGGLFTTLLAPRALSVAAQRLGRSGRADGIGAWEGGRRLTSALTTVLDADADAGRWLSRYGVRLPGLSTWAVCRPRSTTAP